MSAFRTFLGNLRATLRAMLRRERELASLCDAVDMMSAARRADAAEWHDVFADARRLRWLAEDHADPDEVRECVRSICQSIPTCSLSGMRLDIDANMGRGDYASFSGGGLPPSAASDS